MRRLHDLLDERALAGPHRPAVATDAAAWTFAELRDRARGLARDVIGPVARPGDRVLLQGGNSPELAAAVFACSYAGAVAVVLHPDVKPFHLRHIAADCGAVLALADAPLLDACRGLGIRSADLAVAGTGSGGGAARPDTGERRPASDPACLIYTSGSTGMPKGVVSPHSQMLFAVRAIGEVLGYRADDVVFCCLPLSFDYGLYQLLLSVAAGSLLHLADQRAAGPALPGRLAAAGATVLPLVPSLADTLLRMLGRGSPVPARLRLITNTGAVLPEAVIAALGELLPAAEVAPMYGLTECKRVSVTEPGDRRPGSVGRPLPGTVCRVVDETGGELPPGAVGELTVAGPHVMPGYWNAPELTARRFRPDAAGTVWLHTGDLFRADADGYLYFVGRHDDVYKVNGFRVGAAEVEAAALDVPGVSGAAVLPPERGRPARLFVTGSATAHDVVAGLAERIERFKVPGECTVVERLPLTPHGKVDRAALAALAGGAPTLIPGGSR
ncbi:MAG: class I adenylate-forming enzyme family protein [Catenulispora sp.]